MKDIADIVKASVEAKRHGIAVALATVVALEGSSYRQPGARMLVHEDGSLVGAISGGCLEGDARRKALFAIQQTRPVLATYDSMDEEGERLGIQLGCMGKVTILFEPVDWSVENHPLLLLALAHTANAPVCLVTAFDPAPDGQHRGTGLLRSADRTNASCAFHADEFAAHIGYAMQTNETQVISARPERILLHVLPAPVSLVIAGAGNDAVPLAAQAHALGWHVTVIDGRATHATTTRFPMVNAVCVTKPGEPLPAATAYMLMSHNYPYDLAVLKQLASTPPRYIGLLGPRHRRERLLAELAELDTPALRNGLHGPAGLDIGAEGAEEIALAVLAEIKAFLSRASSGSLRDKSDPIHQRPAA